VSPRKSFTGRIRGERLTRKKGVSIEFADFREYGEGDDLRHLDWNVLARLDTPVMRTYQDEEDLAVHVLLDASPSMRFGDPPKFELAKSCALAFSYVALAGGDTVYPQQLGRRAARPLAVRGRSGFGKVAGWADQIQDSTESLSASLRSFANGANRTGLVALLSDGLDPELESAIRVLAGRGHEILFLQILSEMELDPDLEGDLRLVDGEGGEAIELTANGAVLKEYRRRLEAHNKALFEAVQRAGGRMRTVTAGWPIQRVLKEVWKRDGWLR
jgi:uncharacterized protein (DUF58 family)